MSVTPFTGIRLVLSVTSLGLISIMDTSAKPMSQIVVSICPPALLFRPGKNSSWVPVGQHHHQTWQTFTVVIRVSYSMTSCRKSKHMSTTVTAITVPVL